MGESAEDLLAALCADLRLLWRQAGGPSLRELQQTLGLGKSQLGAILGGQIRRPPDWEIVSGLIREFHRYAADHGHLDRLSLRTAIAEYWRPRYGVIEHAFTAGPRRVPISAEVKPAMLPAAVPAFAGRARELAELDKTAGGVDGSPAVIISAVSGMPGVGKTALAVHWAHRIASHFPDGQLYVNLRGFGPAGAIVGAADGLRACLEALGTSPERIPTELDARAALFRTVLAGRKVLVLLDNARDVDQVRPLLPGTPGCLAIVTSRNHLAGLLAVEGAVPMELDVLSSIEAHDLLARRLGAARVAAEPEAVQQIIDHCGRLPLALAVVAARAVTRPRFSLASLAAELKEAAGLDGLHGGDLSTDVRGVFAWSYRAISADAARLFRHLSLHPGRDITIAAAASLDAATPAATRARLGELTGAHLLIEPESGRFVLHDLLLAYASERAEAEDSPAQCDAATGRLLDHLLHTALVAALRVNPVRDPLTVDAPRAGAIIEELADRDAAVAWFDAEHHVLRTAIAHAGAKGFDAHAWRLAWASRVYFARRGLWREYEEIARGALEAARRMGDLEGEADALRSLALACLRLGHTTDANSHFHAALARYAELGDAIGQALTHLGLQGLTDDPRETLWHATQAAEHYRSVGNRAGEANALNAIGWSHARHGDFGQALEWCYQALAILDELGDRDGLAATWDSLGFAHNGLADHARAEASYEQALAVYRELGYRFREADTLVRLGDARSDAGDHEAAGRAWRRSIDILQDLDHPAARLVRAKLSQAVRKAQRAG